MTEIYSSQILALPSRGQSCKLRGRGIKGGSPASANRGILRPKDEHTFLTQLFWISFPNLLKGNHYQHVEREIYILKSLFLELLKEKQQEAPNK